jgi:hypothetical protein
MHPSAGRSSAAYKGNDTRHFYLHPNHPLELALRYVERWPVAPVVNGANFSQLEGVVSKEDVLARYQESGDDQELG